MKSSDSRFNRCLYSSSGALARKMEKRALESWKKIALFPSHAYSLLIVLEEPGVKPGAIAKQLQLTPSTITRLIEEVEEKINTSQPGWKNHPCLSSYKSKIIISQYEKLPG